MRINLLYVVIIIIFCCCKTVDQPSANYCTFLIDGSNFKADCGGGANPSFGSCLKGELDGNVHIFSLSGSNGSEVFGISIYDSTNQFNSGKYILSYDQKNSSSSYNANANPYIYSTDSEHTGYIFINFDKKNQLASGTFSFVAKYQLDTSTVRITQGSFSVHYIVD
jgi:hypothetical protein